MGGGKMPKRKILFSGVLLLAVFVSLCSAISEDEIQRLSRVMNWKAGQVVADVGAGEGEIGFAAAAAVGESGKVYLTELDEQKLTALQKTTSRRKLKNVVVLAAAEKETRLPDSCCDAIILRRVYHHLTAPVEMDASLLRSLRSGGLLAVIEFPPRKSLTASDPVKGVPANRGGHGIPKKILVEELTAAGFKLEKSFDDWPDDGYCVLFRKP
jgi:ubiquinone/menaquinone biosynthesis C-methylase UbiE